MSKFTERLLQVAALVVMLWFGWTLAKESIIWNLQLAQKAAQLEQQLIAAKEAAKPVVAMPVPSPKGK